jgi:hypothetical protein
MERRFGSGEIAVDISSEHLRFGKVGYDAYCKQTGGVSLISGDKLPEFDALKSAIKDAWAAAAQAVALEIVETGRKAKV